MNQDNTPAFYREDYLNLSPQQMGQFMQSVNPEQLSPAERGIYQAMSDSWKALYDRDNAPPHMVKFMHEYAAFAGLDLNNPQHRNHMGDMLVNPAKYSEQWSSYKQAMQQKEQAKVQPETAPAGHTTADGPETAKQQQDRFMRYNIKTQLQRDLQQNANSEMAAEFRKMAESLAMDINRPEVQEKLVDAYIDIQFMRENPAMLQQSLQQRGYSQEQIDRISQKGQALFQALEENAQEYGEKQNKTRKKGMIGALFSLALGAVTAYFTPKLINKRRDEPLKGWKKFGSATAGGLVTMFLSNTVISRLITKPAEKQGDNFVEKQNDAMKEMIQTLIAEQEKVLQQPEPASPAQTQQMPPPHREQQRSNMLQELIHSRQQEASPARQMPQEKMMPKPKRRALPFPEPQTSHVDGVDKRNTTEPYQQFSF